MLVGVDVGVEVLEAEHIEAPHSRRNAWIKKIAKDIFFTISPLHIKKFEKVSDHHSSLLFFLSMTF